MSKRIVSHLYSFTVSLNSSSCINALPLFMYNQLYIFTFAYYRDRRDEARHVIAGGEGTSEKQIKL